MYEYGFYWNLYILMFLNYFSVDLHYAHSYQIPFEDVWTASEPEHGNKVKNRNFSILNTVHATECRGDNPSI